MGLFMLAFGFGIWWPVMKYAIRADREGISQTNGFFHQSARWTDVANYYVAQNPRIHKERRLHIEPVMLNADGIVIFQGFAHLLVSSAAILEQRRALWQFVEAQLEGKRIEAPSPDLDPGVIAWRSLQVDWSKKSLLWKIARMFALVCFTLFWLAFSMGPIYYMVSRNITVPQPFGTLMLLLSFIGPLLPHIIWFQIKKRQIARELKKRSAAE